MPGIMQVVGPGGEPGREAAQAQPEDRRHGLVLAHVHEHAERLVAERPRPRRPPSAAATLLAHDAGPAGWRAGRSAGTALGGALAGSGTAAASPMAQTLSPALHPQRARRSRSGRPARAAGRARSTTPGGLHAGGPADACRVGIALAGRTAPRCARPCARAACRCGSRSRGRAARAWRTRRGSRGISGMIRSCASTRIQRVPVERGSAGSGRSGRPRSPGARRCPRRPRSPRPTNTKVRYSRRSSASSSDSAISRLRSARLRSAIASASVLKPSPCSARPGTGSTRETEPSGDDQLVVAKRLVAPVERRGRSSSLQRRVGAGDAAERMSVQSSSSRSGTTTWRGSSVPAAAPGSSGV